MTKSGTSLNFKYNSSGLRTEKSVNGVPTKYPYLGGQVAFETTGAETIHYTYDDKGAPFSMTYGGNEYFYLTNVQGDVTGLADAAGATVVIYTYDSWGKLILTDGSMKDTLGVKNPYRYRGYRYDIETGLYYLQSRYYNPEIGRFINSDNESLLLSTIDELTDKNLFSYCDNNPITRTDDSGERWNWSKIFTAVAVVATVVSIGALVVASAGTVGIAVVGGKIVSAGGTKFALSLAYKSAIVSVSSNFIDLNIRRFAKGGKQKINDSSLIGIPDAEISRRLKDPSTL